MYGYNKTIPEQGRYVSLFSHHHPVLLGKRYVSKTLSCEHGLAPVNTNQWNSNRSTILLTSTDRLQHLPSKADCFPYGRAGCTELLFSHIRLSF